LSHHLAIKLNTLANFCFFANILFIPAVLWQKTQTPRLFWFVFLFTFVFVCFHHMFVFVCFVCFLSLFIQMTVRTILKGEFDKINKEKKQKKPSYAYNPLNYL